MEIDKRSHKRFNPEGLAAHIMIDPPPPEPALTLDGVVVDMSYRGIKIKLNQPLAQEVNEAELRICIVLPESGVPMSIHGKIRHLRERCECGLQYAEQHTEDELDMLMFECVKYACSVREEE